MIQFIRTNSENHDFQFLVSKLDEELKALDGEDHAFYAQFNKIANLKYAVVAYEVESPVGCGALKEYSGDVMEVKRMYVPVMERGRGIASGVLAELEKWAGELGYSSCILETGKRQPDAIRLYTRSGYSQIPNFGQYENDANSLCFEKHLNGD